MPRWGVDSSWYPVNQNVSVPNAYLRPGETGPVEEPLFDYVTRRAGRRPEFWGRYLNDNHAETRLRPDEPQYLFHPDRNCRLALVFNGIRSQPHGPDASRRGGESAARRAIAQAGQYNITDPSQVRIYLDLEGWTVTPDFLEGWWSVMHASQYAGAGGLYGRGAETRLRRGSYLRDLDHRPYSAGWARRVITAEDRIEEQQMDSLLDDLASGRSSESYSIYIWSNTARRYDEHRDTPRDAEIVPATFGAVGPVGSLMTRTVIWQYRFGAFWERGADRGTVDLDLALEAAYQNMWGS